MLLLTQLKCIKQLEQEKDLIMQGIKALDIGHQWFQRRLCEVQERQRQVENVGIKSTAIETEFVLGLETEPGSASTRLDLFLTKVSQMNRLLKSIVDLSNVNVCEKSCLYGKAGASNKYL